MLKLQPLGSDLQPKGECLWACSIDISDKGFAFQVNEYIDFSILTVTIVDVNVTENAQIQHVSRNSGAGFNFTVGCEFKSESALYQEQR